MYVQNFSALEQNVGIQSVFRNLWCLLNISAVCTTTVVIKQKFVLSVYTFLTSKIYVIHWYTLLMWSWLKCLFRYILKMSNPWESEPSYIKTGGLQHILDVNKRFSTYERSDQVSIIIKRFTSITSIKI